MTTGLTKTEWERGRLDARGGQSKLLFGRMYEDALIELNAFRAGGRVFCIASAGCTAMKLAPGHEVVAVDINPVQLAYARRRFAGERGHCGVVERIMRFARAFAPLAGWRTSTVRAFLDLDDPGEQLAYWRRYLNTRRFRAAMDSLFSMPALRTIYASSFLKFLPPNFGAVMRRRMERCFARHPNRTNAHAHALLLGELSFEIPPLEARNIRVVHADAATFLEHEPAGSFDGFTLSNILDGADSAYQRRLLAAVKSSATPGAIVVLRSFREPSVDLSANHAADDAAMIWGIVSIEPAAAL